MTLTEIKKELYKQKPKADLINVTKSGILYTATIKMFVSSSPLQNKVRFLVPLSEIGDAMFGPTGVESQLLIRYIVTPETENK